MSSKRIPEIETERLLLRQVTTADLDARAERVFANPEVMRFMPKRDMTPLQRAERAFNNYNRLWGGARYLSLFREYSCIEPVKHFSNEITNLFLTRKQVSYYSDLNKA